MNAAVDALLEAVHSSGGELVLRNGALAWAVRPQEEFRVWAGDYVRHHAAMFMRALSCESCSGGDLPAVLCHRCLGASR